MTATATSVYQGNQHDYAPRELAVEFARVWFAAPRKLAWYNEKTRTFQLVNGNATYEVRARPGVVLQAPALWEIVRV